MYLARKQAKGETRYIIRESLPSSGHFIHRDLFDLGKDPTRFIHYPGGKGYYFDPDIEDALTDKGASFHPNDLDDLFFEFLPPDIQRVITGFDRNYRRRPQHPSDETRAPAAGVHIFDKRRFHYIRFGHSDQRHIQRVPEHMYRPLQRKSRDELEHYFESEEGKLRYPEKGNYIATVFQLTAFTPSPHEELVQQLDAHFIQQVCRLNNDPQFMAGEPASDRLYPFLIRYVIFYFDFGIMQRSSAEQYINDFINRHRIHRPTGKTAVKIKEAEALFGYRWKELKKMDKSKLNHIYRRLALKHHPDQGGDAGTFRRISKYYKALRSK